MSTSRKGMTLVEVMVAVVLTVGVSAGLYEVGSMARRNAEYARLATEARSRGKEQLEELLSYRLVDLQQPAFQWRCDTNESAMGYEIVRTPRVVWHGANTALTGVSSSVYAELHVDVAFRPPLWKITVTNTFSSIVSE